MAKTEISYQPASNAQPSAPGASTSRRCVSQTTFCQHVRTAWINVRWTPTLSPPALATVTGSRTLPAGPVHLARLGSTSPECALEGTSSKTTPGCAVPAPRHVHLASSCQGPAKLARTISTPSSALRAVPSARLLASTCMHLATEPRKTQTPTIAGHACPAHWEDTCPRVHAGTEVPRTAVQEPAACANLVKWGSTLSQAADAMATEQRTRRPVPAAIHVRKDPTYQVSAAGCQPPAQLQGRAPPAKHALQATTGRGATAPPRQMTCSVCLVDCVDRGSGSATDATEADSVTRSRFASTVLRVHWGNTTHLGALEQRAVRKIGSVHSARAFAIPARMWPRAAEEMPFRFRIRHLCAIHAIGSALMDPTSPNHAAETHLYLVLLSAAHARVRHQRPSGTHALEHTDCRTTCAPEVPWGWTELLQ